MNYKTLLTQALAFSTLALGCAKEPGDAISDALPTAEQVRVNLPDQGGAQQAALGELSEYYALTRGITREFNAGAGFVLLLVHTIVQYPATTVNGNTYTWGPGSDPLDPADYQLIVVDNLDGTYDWHLDGRSKQTPEAGFLTIVSGHAVEGADPHRGSGDFTYDLDAAREVNPIDNADDQGRVTVVYDLENRDGTSASLEMHIEGVDEQGADFVADYHYAEMADRSGDFQFSLPTDVNEDGSAKEDVILRSRWLADGSGRGDARITGGDLGADVVEASQCWDTTFATVFYTDTHDIIPTEGEESACSFTDRDLPDA